jgi:molecular chaperone HtpG
MREVYAANAEDPRLEDFANILYGYALLAEGSEITEPQKFNDALLRVVAKAL